MKFNMLHKVTFRDNGTVLGKLGAYGATAESSEEAFLKAKTERARLRLGPMFKGIPVKIETTLTWSEDK